MMYLLKNFLKKKKNCYLLPHITFPLAIIFLSQFFHFFLRDYLRSPFRIFFLVMIFPPECFFQLLQLHQPISTNILRHIFVNKCCAYVNHTTNLFLNFALNSESTSYILLSLLTLNLP